MRQALCFAPGYEPYHLSDHLTQIRTGAWRGEVYTLQHDDDPIGQLLRLIDGQRSQEEILHTLPPELQNDGAQFLDHLLQAGLLVKQPVPEGWAPPAPLARYLQSLSYSPADIAALREAKVLLVGAGALGSRVAVGLAQLGIAAITLCDDQPISADDRAMSLVYASAKVGTRRATFLQHFLPRCYPGTACQRAALPLQQIRDLSALVAQHRLVIASCDRPAPTITEALNSACLQARTPWLHLSSDSLQAAVGPLFLPGETGCFTCWEQGMSTGLSQEERRDQARLRAHRKERAERPFVGSPGMADWIASLVLADLPFLLANRPNRFAGRHLLVDLLTQEISLHELRKRPRCATCGAVQRF